MNEAKQTFEKFSKPNESEGEEQADKIMKHKAEEPAEMPMAESENGEKED